jgi:hypothetical protein
MRLNSVYQTVQLMSAAAAVTAPAASVAQNSSTCTWVGAVCHATSGNSVYKVGSAKLLAKSNHAKSVLRSRFAALRSLEAGWDGPNSIVPDQALVSSAARILDNVMRHTERLEAPYVVPVANGGIQAEWYSPQHRLEVYFDADGEISAWSENRETGVEMEEDDTAAIQLLAEWVAARELDLSVAA